MHDNFYIDCGDGKYKIFAYITRLGSDLGVLIGGGEKPHIGAVAVAVPRKSLKKDGSDSSTASVICLNGHKDDEPAKLAALTIAAKFYINVIVSVGLHIDNAGSDDIKEMNKNFKLLLSKIVDYLQSKGY